MKIRVASDRAADKLQSGLRFRTPPFVVNRLHCMSAMSMSAKITAELIELKLQRKALSGRVEAA
jgi:hypothetical protein